MKCPACCSEIDDRSYRATECHRICSYKRLLCGYRYIFYGFKTTFYRDLPAFEAEAAKLDRILTHLDEDYKSITIVTHSNGGLVAMRTLLNRAKDFPAKQPHKIHRIVMFTPLTENGALAGQPDIVELLGQQSTEVAQMQGNTFSKLVRGKEDL